MIFAFHRKTVGKPGFFGVKVSGVHLELSCCCCKDLKEAVVANQLTFIVLYMEDMYTHYVGGNQELLILKVISKILYTNTKEFDFSCQSQDNFYGDP